MKNTRGWVAFEQYVNNLLGLDRTVSSGNQWHDVGDGVDRSRSDFALQVDAKFTEAGSFTVNAINMRQWCERAQGLGKRFALPVRLMPKWANKPEDYIVLRLDDFAELMSKLREHESGIFDA